MSRFFAAVAMGASWLGRAAVGAMSLLIVAIVCARFAGLPIVGSVDLVKYLMVAIVALAVAYTQYAESHISIGLLMDRFPPSVQKGVEFVGFILAALVAGLFSYVFVKSAFFVDSADMVASGLLKIPAWPFKLILALGFGLWSLFSFVSAWRALRETTLRDAQVGRVDL